MTSHARWVLLLVASLLLPACSSTPKDGSGTGSKPGTGESSAKGGEKDPEADNMLEDEETNQFLLDVDRYTEEWQTMRERGRVAAYGGLENLVRQKVDGDVDRALAILGDKENPRGQLIVSKALGFSDDPRTHAALIGLLREDDPAILENALMGLSMRPSRDVPANDVAYLLDHFDVNVRRNAALALRQAVRKGAPLDAKSKERALTRLTVMLLDPDHPAIRGNAAAALGVIGGPEAESDLLSLLADQDVYPRLRAVVALSHVGTERALEPLIHMLGSAEANVRHLAARALWVITNRLGYSLDGTVLGENAQAWRAAIEARRDS